MNSETSEEAERAFDLRRKAKSARRLAQGLSPCDGQRLIEIAEIFEREARELNPSGE
jgi:hypothetical protein